jgi:hypothetical protein
MKTAKQPAKRKPAKKYIEFHTKSDKAKMDVKLTGIPQLEIVKANIIEGMTARNRVGIIFEIEDENGKKYFTKTSAQIIMNGLAPAVRGFCMRVGDNPDMP